jgi:Putative HNHc nuclease
MKTIIRSPEYLAWLREQPCAVGLGCEGRTEACHVRKGTDGGMGMKPSDNFALPLCQKHHREQHRIGEPSFEQRNLIAMKIVAARYWNKWESERGS